MNRISLERKATALPNHLRITGEKWIIDPSQDNELFLSDEISLRISAFSFVDASDTLVQKPIRIECSYLQGLQHFINYGKPSVHIFGLLSHIFQCHITASRGKQELNFCRSVLLHIVLPDNIDIPLNAQLAFAERSSFVPVNNNKGTGCLWNFCSSKFMHLVKENGFRILKCRLSKNGWWSVATLRLSDFSRPMFSVWPINQQKSFDDLRAILLYENMNSYFELTPTNRGFSSMKHPKLPGLRLAIFDKNGINCSPRQRIIDDLPTGVLRLNLK